jgi:hypothetical protein
MIWYRLLVIYYLFHLLSHPFIVLLTPNVFRTVPPCRSIAMLVVCMVVTGLMRLMGCAVMAVVLSFTNILEVDAFSSMTGTIGGDSPLSRVGELDKNTYRFLSGLDLSSNAARGRLKGAAFVGSLWDESCAGIVVAFETKGFCGKT